MKPKQGPTKPHPKARYVSLPKSDGVSHVPGFRVFGFIEFRVPKVQVSSYPCHPRVESRAPDSLNPTTLGP